MITFLVVGHNEESTLHTSLGEAMAASGSGDEVVFLDSASTDRSAEVAASLGATRWAAPLGKGAAMRSAMRQNQQPWMIFLDADLVASEHNIAQALAATVSAGTSADLVLGDFEDRPSGGVLSSTRSIYEPLVNRLFPEAALPEVSKPLTGFRALRAQVISDLDSLPPDFGIEARLNIDAQLDGSGATRVHLGWYEGRFLYKPGMGTEIGAAILDSAVQRGRVHPRARPAWDAWVATIVEVIATYRGQEQERAAYLSRLRAVASRPMPES